MELVGTTGGARWAMDIGASGSCEAGCDFVGMNFWASIPGIAAGEEKNEDRSNRLSLTADAGAWEAFLASSSSSCCL